MPHLRFALRKLVQQPLFAALAIGTLGLGIGCVVTFFSAVNTLLFRPLPAATEGSRLVWITQTKPAETGRESYGIGVNSIDRDTILARSRELDHVWLFADLTVILRPESTPVRVLGTRIEPDGFTAMGVQPQIGRNFAAADLAPDAPQVILISDQLWRAQFHADPGVLNTCLEFNGQPMTIIGVMPPGWRYPDYSDVWMPLNVRAAMPGYADAPVDRAHAYFFNAHGRLAPGATVASARAELTALAESLALPYPDTDQTLGLKLASWRDQAHGGTLYFTLLLFAAGVAIFLISCANIANLQLARGSSRGSELAVRLALGASRWQVFRQLLLENLVLGLLGAGVGAVVGLWGIDLVVRSMNIEPPFWLVLDPDWRVLAFTVGCGFLASLLFGLAPALRDSRPQLVAGLKESSRTGLDQGPYGQGLRNTIVVIEIALALVLLVGAGLMTRSFVKLRAADSGYNAAGVLTFRVGFPVGVAADDTEIRAFFGSLPEQLRHIPEVTHAAAVTSLPGERNNIGRVELTTAPATAPIATPTQVVPDVAYRGVTPDYFATMEIALLAGRDFTSSDDMTTAPVVIVDAAFAAAVGLSPAECIGRFLGTDTGFKSDPALGPPQIIGVVASIRHLQAETERLPTLYYATRQAPVNFMTAVVRTTGDPALLASAVGNEVLNLNPGLPIYNVLTLEQVLLRSIWMQYFFSRLFLAAGCIALLLACIGIYGVMTFAVTMRRHEIGLRMALGAPPGEVVREILHRGAYLVVLGLGAGLLAATLLANFLVGVLHGVSPHDWLTFLTVPVLLAAIAMIACYVPSLRATRIDPMAAMRNE